MLVGFSQKFSKGKLKGMPTLFKEKHSSGHKIHTMREDVKNRWRVGMGMQLCYGVRTKQFEMWADTECKAIQIVNIKYSGSAIPEITIDGRLCHALEIVMLAINDGFDSLDDFLAWFDKDGEYKLLHWTDFIYDGDVARYQSVNLKMQKLMLDKLHAFPVVMKYMTKEEFEESGHIINPMDYRNTETHAGDALRYLTSGLPTMLGDAMPFLGGKQIVKSFSRTHEGMVKTFYPNAQCVPAPQSAGEGKFWIIYVPLFEETCDSEEDAWKRAYAHIVKRYTHEAGLPNNAYGMQLSVYKMLMGKPATDRTSDTFPVGGWPAFNPDMIRIADDHKGIDMVHIGYDAIAAHNANFPVFTDKTWLQKMNEEEGELTPRFERYFSPEAEEAASAPQVDFNTSDPEITVRIQPINTGPGIEPGDMCNREGCEGILNAAEPDGDGCSCYINPPCSYCCQCPIECPVCLFHDYQKA